MHWGKMSSVTAAKTVVILVILSSTAVEATLPEGFKGCSRSSPEFEECLKTQASFALKFFKDGNKKMGVIPLDPLKFETMNLYQGSGPVSIDLKMNDIQFLGLSKVIVQSVKTDWKTLILAVEIPNLVVKAEYIVKGKILILPISGRGNLTLTWKTIKAVFNMTMSETNKGGVTYLQVKSMPVTFTIERVIFNFQNLFRSKEIGEKINDYLNENWEVIVKELEGTISDALDVGYRAYINTILGNIPAKDIIIN